MSHPVPRRRRPGVALAAAALVATLACLTGCGSGDDYCETVTSSQAELTDIGASGTPVALLEALPVFRRLADRAPDDIGDDWQTLIDPLQELDDALRAAGVEPSAFEADGLPGSVSEAERERIQAAGLALGDPAVAQAFDAVQQQAKDVCHTPLSL